MKWLTNFISSLTEDVDLNFIILVHEKNETQEEKNLNSRFLCFSFILFYTTWKSSLNLYVFKTFAKLRKKILSRLNDFLPFSKGHA